ncbi:blue copper protein 1a-like [Magnolia sinica]|uniref:blue copper protein 1a-like n=1 Tax=Magnolia sinica TaxID=86752 RepID=UPI00265B588F|nr:blue copper protein 1a-like [Magnolia sinica]
MASKQMYVVLAVMVVILPSVALATEYVVGDDKGWTPNFDYQTWAAGKDFTVGDNLVFKYDAAFHDVFKVNGTAFKDCIIPPANESLNTGNDIITLVTPGRKWYICGKSDHCAKGGQKLAITVSDSLAPASPPQWRPEAEAPNSANGIVAAGYQALMVGIAAIVLMIMV